MIDIFFLTIATICCLIVGVACICSLVMGKDFKICNKCSNYKSVCNGNNRKDNYTCKYFEEL